MSREADTNSPSKGADGIVTVKNLSKRYEDIRAVNDITFSIYEGEIFCIVGPNGAGKTTTIEMIEGLRKSDSGEIRVFGLEPSDKGVKERIGVQLQESSFYDRAKVRECVDMFRGFYPDPLPVDDVLKQVGLQERGNMYYKKLSGGQKQRVAIAVALSSNPTLLFLDEISTGLDPQSRRAMWEMILELQKRGKTIFMTTHYMEEAERLANRVGIIDHGEIIALDTPENLIKEHGGGSRITYEGPAIEIGEGTEHVDGRTIIYANDPKTLVPKLMNEASKRGIDLKKLRVEEPSLEDVFLRLTGREMRD